MHITSDGTVFGTPDPALLTETRENQNLFNTNMVSYRLQNGRPILAINFRTKQHMPAVYLTAGMYPGLATIEAQTPHFVTVSIPYREPDDVTSFRNHFRDLWQMTRSA